MRCHFRANRKRSNPIASTKLLIKLYLHIIYLETQTYTLCISYGTLTISGAQQLINAKNTYTMSPLRSIIYNQTTQRTHMFTANVHTIFTRALPVSHQGYTVTMISLDRGWL